MGLVRRPVDSEAESAVQRVPVCAQGLRRGVVVVVARQRQQLLDLRHPRPRRALHHMHRHHVLDLQPVRARPAGPAKVGAVSSDNQRHQPRFDAGGCEGWCCDRAQLCARNVGEDAQP
eukprot:1945194-Rhodomonas_salina.1